MFVMKLPNRELTLCAPNKWLPAKFLICFNFHSETGQFEGIPIICRLCPFCHLVEDESHLLLNCTLYNDIRNVLFSKAISLLPEFNSLVDDEKLKLIFTEYGLIRITAMKFCTKIFFLMKIGYYWYRCTLAYWL